jgi:NADH-quinone oxidoreductase subunit H
VPSQLATVVVERRLIGKFQLRPGPNRVGPGGLLQPVADALKGLFKESWVPAGADRWVFIAAPLVFFVPAIAIYAIMPWGPGMQLVDLNLGLLFVMSIGSIGVIGVFMAGWSSNNKYSLLGAMRSVAQLVSYEIPMLLSVMGVILLVGSLNMSAIVQWQIDNSVWFFLLQPLGLIVFFIAGLAEAGRTPFDLAEAESELGAGYHTEYPGISFMMFYAAEYTHALAFCGLTAAIFFGGWAAPPFLDFIPPYLWFLVKLWFFFCVLVWIRATLPRLRMDQLMSFAWKFLIPLAMINVAFTALQVLVLESGLLPQEYLIAGGVVLNIVVAGFLIVAWTNLLQQGRRQSAAAAV